MKKTIISIVIVGVVAGGAYYIYRHSGDVSTANPSSETFTSSAPIDPTGGVKEEDVAQIPTYKYTETYTHPAGDFSFRYPKDFDITDIPNDDGSEAILVQNLKTKIGVQIYITKYAGNETTLTADMIHQSIPSLTITEPQEVLLGGGSAGKGLAFLSNNKSFGGSSREVWFIYKGHLYQISTYQNLDEFLKGLFGTWKFQ